MLYLTVFVFLIIVQLMSSILSLARSHKLSNGVSFFLLLCIYSFVIVVSSLLSIGILTISRIFWFSIICFLIIGLMHIVLKHKLRYIKNQFLGFVISITVTLIFYWYSQLVLDSVGLLPLSHTSDGLITAINYLNNSLNVIQENNYLTMFFVSFIAFIPNNVSLSNVQYILLNTMIIVSIFLIANYFVTIVLTKIDKNTDFKLLLGVCFFELYFSYEVLKFGYSNDIYLMILFVYFFYSLFQTKINWIVIIVLSTTLFLINGININSILQAFIILSIIFVNSHLSKFNSKICFRLLYSFLVLLSITIFFNIEAFYKLLVPSQANVSISFFTLQNKNCLVLGVLVIVYFLSVINNRYKFLLLFIMLLFLLFICVSLYYPIINLSQFNYLLINPAIFLWAVDKEQTLLLSKKFDGVIYASILIVFYSLSSKMLINPYYESFNSFNHESRIDQDELDIYNFIISNENLGENSTFISHAPNTIYFVPNINIIDSYENQLLRCQYCDVNKMGLHQDSEVVNIFAYRESEGNRLFIEEPKYEKGCELIQYNDVDYLILLKDQVIEVNGNWHPLYLYYNNCSKVLYENESYALLKSFN